MRKLFEEPSYIESKVYREELNKEATFALTGAQILIFRTLRHKIDKNVSASEILPTTRYFQLRRLVLVTPYR